MTNKRNPSNGRRDNSSLKDSLHDFMLEEYKNISEAHYNTIESVSNFFKHYLLIISLPITSGLVAIKLNNDGEKLNGLISKYGATLGIVAILIAIVGTCVLTYLANLRHDSILYARGVNGTRRYFADRSKLTYDDLKPYRVLPVQKELPRYFETHSFLWVATSIALINGSYFGVGLFLFLKEGPFKRTELACWWRRTELSNWWMFVAFLIIGFLINMLVYYLLCYNRERGRLFNKKIIGVDIDGVLNEHRIQFCKIFNQIHGRNVSPDQINHIPTSECAHLGISSKEERRVFNTVAYWTNMPVRSDASQNLTKLRNILGFKIFIFTHRGWPDVKRAEDYTKEERRAVEKEWDRTAGALRKIRKESRIYYITKRWLSSYRIPYDKFVVEWGNIYTSQYSQHSRNRFIWAQKKGIRFFVEDDYDKAKRLADICELVYLIDQPYNQNNGRELPINVIRVRGWDELYRHIRNQ